MQNAFGYDARQAKIQGLSVQVGELFADMYKDSKSASGTLEALEAYKSLRRLLPMDPPRGDSKARHSGANAAYHATQGFGS